MGTDMVFVDASAFIALAANKDESHERAVGIYEVLTTSGARLFTTNHVVDEVCNWLLWDRTLGHRFAVRFGEFIQTSWTARIPHRDQAAPIAPWARTLVYSDPDLERLAWDIFARYDTAGFSFTDCVSFAAMQSLGIKKAFTFDKHYDTMGFERL